MKRIVLLTSLALSTAILANATEVSANTEETDVVSTHVKKFNELEGTHLKVNITGVDMDRNVILRPRVVEFPLTIGSQLDLATIQEMVLATINATLPNTYELTEYANVQLEVNNERYRKTNLPIPEVGFAVPGLTYYGKTPVFNLSGTVTLRETLKATEEDHRVVAEKPIGGKHVVDTDDVEWQQEVTFKKKDGTSLISTGVMAEAGTGYAKIGDEISSELLWNNAQKLFETTKEAKEGYKLVKRLSTEVMVDSGARRFVYDSYEDNEFKYIVQGNRQPSDSHTDAIIEIYYIAKEDETDEKQIITLQYVDEATDVTLVEKEHEIFSQVTIEGLKSSLNEGDKTIVGGKNGNTYEFTGKIVRENKDVFKIYYREQ
ncbi:hypothetical protein D3X11_04955 [Streptococcus sp. X16XC17]|uniref:hypothetical protein n=1 Tax=unclassified Streptococcus TaxID=2608887 RepID=UPI00066FD689|nr:MULTISPECIES: hypothetical protein [unclassified Streptococcus]TCD46720.1 hypothetical protein D3X11_04955 [Streptococcus sp. X16XC17]